MKKNKIIVLLSLLLSSILLFSCGEETSSVESETSDNLNSNINSTINDISIDDTISNTDDSLYNTTADAINNTDDSLSNTDDTINNTDDSLSNTDDTISNTTNANPMIFEPVENDSKKYPLVDLDITSLSGTMAYAQVYDMMFNYENYLGKTIKVSGLFNISTGIDGTIYTTAYISDAAACCATGIEFEWAGDHIYPNDYPELGTEITATGIFDVYEESDNMYMTLRDAELEW